MRIYLLLLLLLLAMPLEAADVIRVDPNTPEGQAATVEQDANQDPRIAQKITYEARRKPVRVILADLSELSGVTLNAGYNDNDWQVRDRRMNIFAKDTPLISLMNSIARVMKFNWSVNRQPELPTYRLYMNRKILLEADAKNYRMQEEFNREMEDWRERAVEDVLKIADMSPADAAGLRESNPYGYMLYSTGVAQPFATLMRINPGIHKALMNGEELILSAGDLSPEELQAATLLVEKSWVICEKGGAGNHYDNSGSKMPLPHNISKALNTLKINPDSDDVQSMIPQINVEYSILDDTTGESTGRHDFVEALLFKPDQPFARVYGKSMTEALETGQPLDDVMDKHKDELKQLYKEERSKIPNPEKVEHPDDPELNVEIKMDVKPEDGKSPRFDDCLATLAGASGYAVVADSHGRQYSPVESGKTTSRAVLDQIDSKLGYNWWKQDGVLELRDRLWFRMRAAQIPDSTLDRWRSTFKNKGYLDINEMSEIAMLTSEQFDYNIRECDDKVLDQWQVDVLVRSSKNDLNLYGILNSSQRKMLFSSSGMELRVLAPEQMSKITRLIRRDRGSISADAVADLVIRVKRSGGSDDHAPAYTFELLNGSDGRSRGSWGLQLPEYQEPEVNKKASAKHPSE